MLTKFSVRGFKGFKKKITLDLSQPYDYDFNTNLIKDKIIKNSLIYGKNSIGKSNLGLAIFDIVFNLTDNYTVGKDQYNNYLNLDLTRKNAEFEYEFNFNNNKVQYIYIKENVDLIKHEKLIINDQVVLDFDHKKPNDKIVNINNTENLNWKYFKSKSALKYIINNTNLSDKDPLSMLMKFVNNMLWFRSVEANAFIGIKNTSENLDDIILDNNKLQDFEDFLKENGINYTLKEMNESTGKYIGVQFKNGISRLNSIASTGTKDLWLFYCWHIYFDKVSFVFIDEFDANYHFDLSANVIKLLTNKKNLQTIVTTHNTYLMSNRLTRPDCTFIITPEKIVSLTNATNKDLLEAHDIEKLYREGHFIN